MTRDEAVLYIESYGWNKRRPGLHRIRRLLEKLGNPQNRLKFIHVAGSNGKGSACAMLDSILRAAGLKVGLFTSPYIEDFCERIQYNGENISGEILGRLTEHVIKAADTMEEKPGQFEMITAIALLYFEEVACDLVVLEVGLGGRMDATNIIPSPEAALIMNIGQEHTEILGGSIEKIAREKAGIIKKGCDCIAYNSSPEALGVIRATCEKLSVFFTPAGRKPLVLLSSSLEGQHFLWEKEEYRLPLLGVHQLKNVDVVLEAISVLKKRGWKISQKAVKRGLKETKWPVRMEVLSRKPLFILDGGHNPQCADALSKSIRELLPNQKIIFLLGFLQDKDYKRVLVPLLPLAKEFICLTPNSERALLSEELADYLNSRGARAKSEKSVSAALLDAFKKSGEDGSIVGFGSLYLAGELRTAFVPCLKKWIRKQKRAARESLSPEERMQKSEAIGKRILEREDFCNAKTIMLYRGTEEEVDPDFLPRTAPEKTYVYPLCLGKGEMEARIPFSHEPFPWRPGAFGIMEPDPQKSRPIEPGEIDLIIAPCTSFDENGNRLGMGGGYYDRFLPRCTGADVIAVAFEVQKYFRIPTEPGDFSVHTIITEERTYEIAERLLPVFKEQKRKRGRESFGLPFVEEEKEMVEVVAALIWEKDRFLICQRPAEKARGLLWEFVGGKVETGETKEETLQRECREELAISVSVGEIYMEVLHEYPDITIHLTLFNAAILGGIPRKLEHRDLKWITPAEISEYSFCPADEEILKRIAKKGKG